LLGANSWGPPGSYSRGLELSSDELPRELRRLRLSLAEQAQVGERLRTVILSRPESRATAFWALGEAPASIALGPTLELLLTVGEQLEDEAAYQACAALRAWLAPGPLDETTAAEARAIWGLRPLLAGWAQAADARLAQAAKILVEILPQTRV